jgi:hypothetical protein
LSDLEGNAKRNFLKTKISDLFQFISKFMKNLSF